MTGKHYVLIIASILCMGISKVFGQDKNSTQGNLTATITNTTPYVGQEVVYKFTISDFINLETQPEYIKPSFENFWVNPDVGYISSDDYIVWETLIVPLYEGSIIIAPGQLRFSARADQASYQLQSNPIELFVQPLPEGAPPAFDGAVGEFDLQAAMNSQQISLGDYLELTITLSGTGNLRVIDPPTIAFPVDWVIIHGQPELIAEQRTDTNYDPNRVGITEGTKRYKWYIQFPAVGGYTIPSINFSYFNPALRQYQMIGTQTVDVEVIPSAQNALSGQARPPQLSTSSLSNWGRPIFLTHSSNSLIQFTTWGLGVVVFVFVCCLVGWLVAWLLTGWLAGQLVGWLVGCLVGWLVLLAAGCWFLFAGCWLLIDVIVWCIMLSYVVVCYGMAWRSGIVWYVMLSYVAVRCVVVCCEMVW